MEGRRGSGGGSRVAVRLLRALAIAVVALAAAAPAAWALEQAQVATGTTNPVLVEREGGGWTVEVTLINLTDAMFTINSQPGDLGDRDCRPEVPDSLPPAQLSKFPVEVPAACDLTGRNFEFEIDVEVPLGDTVASIGFVASPKPGGEDSDSGSDVPVLLLVLLGLAAIAALLAVWAARRRRRDRPGRPPARAAGRDG